jgi:hypothetical protein
MREAYEWLVSLGKTLGQIPSALRVRMAFPPLGPVQHGLYDGHSRICQRSRLLETAIETLFGGKPCRNHHTGSCIMRQVNR